MRQLLGASTRAQPTPNDYNPEVNPNPIGLLVCGDGGQIGAFGSVCDQSEFCVYMSRVRSALSRSVYPWIIRLL